MRRILKAAQDAGCLCSVCFFFSSLLGVLLLLVRHRSSVTLTVNFEKRADRFYLLRRILELLSISRLPLSKCSCRNQSWRALNGYHTERTQNASDHLRVLFFRVISNGGLRLDARPVSYWRTEAKHGTLATRVENSSRRLHCRDVGGGNAKIYGCG